MSSTSLRQPRPFQARGSGWLEDTGRGILGDDPGLGKTGQALLAASEPALIIGPAALRGTWEDEIELWRPGLVYEYTSYSSVCRRKPNARGELRKVAPVPKPDLKGPWGTVICDEAHYLKGRNTAWTRAVEKIDADRLYLLTGTPIPNWSHEIYMLLRLLFPGDRRFSSYWRWVDHWFAIWEPKWGGKRVGKLKKGHTWDRFIVENGLADVMLRRTRDEVLTDLPPLTVHPPVECPMVPAQRKAYAELKERYFTWVEGHGEALAWSSGGLHSALAQITTGLDTYTDGSAKGSGKLDRLQEDLADRAASPTLVGVQYRATARQVAALCERMGRTCGTIMGGMNQTQVDATRRAFQAGELQVLVGTNDKMAEGMTLTRADTLIQVERSWRPSRNDQLVRRIHRMGQDRPVNWITYVTPGSIDDAMTRTLEAKTDEQMEMYTAHAFAQLLREAA